jgi:predicted phage baseplate assembly protein
MTLPTPKLDTRRFQDIVDEAKRLIPRYCPEWTDHNVSDPGITLIELFAWMTDLLLYRTNQIPDRMYIKFLDLIGVRLAPPRAARAPVTFYLSAPQPNAVTIPEDTEVATVRTETNPAVIFTTETDLTVRPPIVSGAFTRAASGGTAAGWTVHDLRQLELPGQTIPVFSPTPAPGDAFYVAFAADHSRHVLALLLDCTVAGGAGIDPTNPPLAWQVYQGGVTRWGACALEYDGTGGFNTPGEVILRLPGMTAAEIQGVHAYWLRCILTDAQAGPNAYRVSPELRRLQVEARGGSVGARHAVTVRDEILGNSDGTAGQTFHLLHAPLLARDPQRDRLAVARPGEASNIWTEVADFADSNLSDQHYTLDSNDGTLSFGPTLLQPDGTVYAFGAVPLKDSLISMVRYQYGGGAEGNLPAGAISVAKSSIPYVAHVKNWEPSIGGRNAQSLDDAKLRAPQALRTRTRAVTADDYEFLARQVVGVARARCLTPGAQPAGAGDLKPGQVVVVVLPQLDAPSGAYRPEQLRLSPEVRAAVHGNLDEHRVLGTTLDVREPAYHWLTVQAVIHLGDGADAGLPAATEQAATAALSAYLDPFVGGPDGTGWPFGRSLHLSELFGLLQRLPAVEYVEAVDVQLVDPDGRTAARAAPPTIELPPHGLFCSWQHRAQATVG